jgi:hypothetical protein
MVDSSRPGSVAVVLDVTGSGFATGLDAVFVGVFFAVVAVGFFAVLLDGFEEVLDDFDELLEGFDELLEDFEELLEGFDELLDDFEEVELAGFFAVLVFSADGAGKAIPAARIRHAMVRAYRSQIAGIIHSQFRSAILARKGNTRTGNKDFSAP